MSWYNLGKGGRQAKITDSPNYGRLLLGKGKRALLSSRKKGNVFKKIAGFYQYNIKN